MLRPALHSAAIRLTGRSRRLLSRLRLPRLAVVAGLLVCATVVAQTAPVVGIRQTKTELHVLDDARLIVRGRHIEAIGKDLELPLGAIVHDMRGLEIWPALLEPWLATDAERAKREAPPAEEHVHGHSVQEIAAADPHDQPLGGAHWNARIHPERSALDDGMPSEERLAKLRASGFALARLVPSSGILRGKAAVLTLEAAAEPSEPHAPRDAGTRIVRAEDVHCAAFERGSGRETYPNSLMGVIALLRQTFYDARWYGDARAKVEADARLVPPVADAALAALAEVAKGRARIAFEVGDAQDALRAQRLRDEFGLDLELRGSGYDFLEARSFLGVPLIVPLPKIVAPEVATAAEASSLSLRELLLQRHARENVARLAAVGVSFSLSSCLLDEPGDFLKELRRAIENGLDPGRALAALTTEPAKLLGVEARFGSLEVGKSASFVVTRGGLFDDGSSIIATWIEGQAHAVDAAPKASIEGAWQLELGDLGRFALTCEAERPLEREAALGSPGAVIESSFEAKLAKAGGAPIEAAVVAAKRVLDRVTILVDGAKLGVGDYGLLRLEATFAFRDGAEQRWEGTASEVATERSVAFVATRVRADEGSKPPTKERKPQSPRLQLDAALPAPLGAFARAREPEQRTVLVRKATLWLSDRRLKDHDLLVHGGKIQAIGVDLAAPPAALGPVLVIDGKGKHVTAGLIDAHSHSAIAGGVNEGSFAVTSEVRIADVLDKDDIAIYRELAGGLTTAHLLHGSANPIGGQSCVIKLRWGASADDLLERRATPTIKFALGENVKQSNWGGEHKTRYPQTRLGVEQILRDRLQMAREYSVLRARGTDERGLPVRRDLQLEALVEVLEGKRRVHCHSYRQDEILMLLDVFRDFGIRDLTLQHVLEGYKVANEIADFGAHASSFSDWWAYKVEVMDAIPYNGAMLHRRGVLTTFNSDSDELARRMNVEAAKAVRYGGLAPEEALCFVTKNAAVQLGIDAFTGSLEVGKDADFVVWSGDPLSTLTRCESTWIEGRRYFDLEEDARLRAMASEEHGRLVAELLALKQSASAADEATKPAKKDGEKDGEKDR